MKFDASSRHSEGYFFEANPARTRQSGDSCGRRLQFTHHDRDTTEGNSTFYGNQGNGIETYPIRQKLSRNPASSVTS
jgi:hypothetical protein